MALPLRDEAELIGPMLDALAGAFAQTDLRCGLVAVANDTTDGSAEAIRRWAERTGHAAAVGEVRLDPEVRGAPHARRLAMDLAAALAPEGFLLTTDADCRVGPGWVDRNAAWLRAGARLVCGAVDTDPAEVAALPGLVEACGVAESRLYRLLEERWRELVPDGSRRFVQRAMGASVALRAADYAAVGGLPTPRSSEDRALATAIRLRGWRIETPEDVRVTASCRLRGRAEGGMAQALLDRTRSADPECDEALVPWPVLEARAAAWRELAASGVADPHGAFEDACSRRPGLTAERMRLAAVQRALAEVDAAPAPAPGTGTGTAPKTGSGSRAPDPEDAELLAGIDARAAAADRGEADLSADAEALRRAGWLAAPLPTAAGGSGWGTEPAGTDACFAALRSLGRVSLPVARLYEGHVNALALVTLYGSERLRAEASAAARGGAFFGVWGADAFREPVALPGGGGPLTGAKDYASGLGVLTHAVVSAAVDSDSDSNSDPGGGGRGTQLLLVPVGEGGRGDASSWRLAGMRATRSGRYRFDGVTLGGGLAGERLGEPDDWFREPHFEGGVWRYCAAHLGGAERLYAQMRDGLAARGRAADPHQQARLVCAAVAVESARMWVLRAAHRVQAEGAGPDAAALSLLAREVTQDACRGVVRTVEEALGLAAHAWGPVERTRRDLSAFVCQAAPDAKRARAAAALVARGVLPESL